MRLLESDPMRFEWRLLGWIDFLRRQGRLRLLYEVKRIPLLVVFPILNLCVLKELPSGVLVLIWWHMPSLLSALAVEFRASGVVWENVVLDFIQLVKPVDWHA